MSRTIAARFKLDYGAFQLDVDLTLPGSGVTVLFGASGSGKTTLLRCLAGLERAAQGFLSINGSIWQDSNRTIFLAAHKRPLGYVFQDANLFAHLTVAGNLQYGLKRISETERSAVDLTRIVELLDIGRLLDRMPERLSGGERQRVAIARALALNPLILLMDEPLAALDSKLKQEIMPFLVKLHTELNIPVLYVTHARQEVAQLADYLVVLEHGKVQTAGPLTETLSRLDLPLAQDRNAASVWDVTVIGHEAEYHLTRVGFAGGMLSLPMIEAAIGKSLRVQIYARDVSITLQSQDQTSILNKLPAIITGIADQQGGQTVIRLQVGQQTLLSHITSKSSHLLALKTGMAVYAQIKGTSLLI